MGSQINWNFTAPQRFNFNWGNDFNAGDSAAITGRAAVIRIEADRPTGVEADGQLLGLAPVRIEAQRGAIDAIVPCDP